MNFTPEQTFAELDRHVIGQVQAKRSVAIALRNRWRRLQLSTAEQASIHPHHILMVGPSGVGKTEIARRLAMLSGSPFVKVEATQYTEVGYVGKEIGNIIEDIVNAADVLMREQRAEREAAERKEAAKAKAEYAKKPEVKEAEDAVFEAIAELMYASNLVEKTEAALNKEELLPIEPPDLNVEILKKAIRDKLKTTHYNRNLVYVPRAWKEYGSEKLEDDLTKLGLRMIAIGNMYDEALKAQNDKMPEAQALREVCFSEIVKLGKQNVRNVRDLKREWLRRALPSPTGAATDISNPNMSTSELADIINRMQNGGRPSGFYGAGYKASRSEDNEAVKFAENYGIIFIDEIDKLAGTASDRGQISRQGVQRDLLPLLDGCMVKTRYGEVNTANMLFICSGAFQLHKPEDLMVEIQGRLPIRVQMEALSVDDFVKILRVKEDNILEQYAKLMRTDGIELVFEDEAVRAIAEVAFHHNMNFGNYGARRLYGCVEKVLEDITYLSSPDNPTTMTITKEFVTKHIGT